MNSVKKIRLALGMGQKEFALILGIERGYLSMIELDKKEVPDYSKEIIEIIKNIIQNTTVDLDFTGDGTHSGLPGLTTKVILLTLERDNKRKKLGNMKSDYISWMIQMRVNKIILGARSNTSKEKEIQSVIDALEMDIEKVKPEEQALLQMEIDKLESRILIKTTMIKRLEGPASQ